MISAHIDTFTFDHLPAADAQPDFIFNLPSLQFPSVLNCATELLDRWVLQGDGERVCLQAPDGTHWTYAQLQAKANQIANVLVVAGLVAGNRVLLRAPNNPMLVACWFAVMKVGGVAVATMPMLRTKELSQIVEKAQVQFALCDARLADELAAVQSPYLQKTWLFNGADASLDMAMQSTSTAFSNVATAATDTCILAFTSGTTGQPKATMHFHRDVMASCACFPVQCLQANSDDVFMGSPPLAFTFGLGGLVLFPMSVGAQTVLLEKAMPAALLDAIVEYRPTVLFTAPTSYRAMAVDAKALNIGLAQGGSLRKCVSAGEALPAATRALWKDATGIELIDGIGATELLHIFISHTEADATPGATGYAIDGYEAKVMDDNGQECAANVVGKLAVRGPTGCRYLADARQASYVKHGWNYTGDAYLRDEAGRFFYQSRTDDMIISAGYNIAAPEVEGALLTHAAVAECAVIGAADDARGQIVKAFVVLRSGFNADEAMIKTLQDYVKNTIAPYKYPRAIAFVADLPKTETGKLQRFKLKITT